MHVFPDITPFHTTREREQYPVKVVEGGSELIHLLLGDALGISCQDLGLHLIDGSGDSCQQQLPSDTDMLPRRRTSNQLGQGGF